MTASLTATSSIPTNTTTTSTSRSARNGKQQQQLQQSNGNVRVVARIRPPTEQEIVRGGDLCLSVPNKQTVEITLCKCGFVWMD